VLRAEGKCACVAQVAREKNRGRGLPSPSQRARYLWVLRTLEMDRGRRLTCETRSSIIAEVKNGLSTHKAPWSQPPGKGPERARAPPQSHSCSETRRPPKSTSYKWVACGLADPPSHRVDQNSSIGRHGRYARPSSCVSQSRS
jgi:hypothetical protein